MRWWRESMITGETASPNAGNGTRRAWGLGLPIERASAHHWAVATAHGERYVHSDLADAGHREPVSKWS